MKKQIMAAWLFSMLLTSCFKKNTCTCKVLATGQEITTEEKPTYTKKARKKFEDDCKSKYHGSLQYGCTYQ